MREFMAIASALSDPNRVRLLLSLNGREMCVCNLGEFIGLADSTVSKHMSILKDAGLVESSKRGRWVYYRLAEEQASPLVRRMIGVARECLMQDRTILADEARILEMLSRDNGLKCQRDAVPLAKHEPQDALATS